MANEEITEKIRIQKEIFIYNLIWLRKHYCIPKKRMAELLGVCISSWNKIEKGMFPGNSSVKIVVNICREFRISSEMFFSRRLGE